MSILFNFSNPTVLTQPMLIGNNVQAPGGSVDALPTPTLLNNVPSSSILELQSTTAGFTIPRMTTAQRLAIVTPIAGMQVYDTTLQLISTFSTASSAAGGWVFPNLELSVLFTAAQINGMFAAPLLIIAAPPAGYGILIHSIYAEAVFGSAAFVGGGPIILQYANTVHGAGINTITNATAQTIPATFLTTFAANQFTSIYNQGLATTASAGVMATAVYLSNTTGAFTVGTGATFDLTVYYGFVAM